MTLLLKIEYSYASITICFPKDIIHNYLLSTLTKM